MLDFEFTLTNLTMLLFYSQLLMLIIRSERNQKMIPQVLESGALRLLCQDGWHHQLFISDFMERRF